MGRGSILFSLGVLVALVVSGYTGVIFYQNIQLNDELDGVQAQLTAAAGRLQEFEGTGVQETIASKETLDLLNQESILWSNVISSVINAVPDRQGRPVVDILSYSGSGGEAIALSLKTNPGSGDPYLDVARFIAAFDDSSDFAEGFVPSIATSVDSEGDEVLSFNFTTRYVDLGSDEVVEVEDPERLQNTINEILEDSLEDEPETPVEDSVDPVDDLTEEEAILR